MLVSSLALATKASIRCKGAPETLCIKIWSPDLIALSTSEAVVFIGFVGNGMLSNILIFKFCGEIIKIDSVENIFRIINDNSFGGTASISKSPSGIYSLLVQTKTGNLNTKFIKNSQIFSHHERLFQINEVTFFKIEFVF
jgi:hypothetical protein